MGKYNVTSAFASAGITPGATCVRAYAYAFPVWAAIFDVCKLLCVTWPSGRYSRSDMTAAISKVFNANAALDCTSGELSALSLCIGKDLSVQTCPSSVGDGSCGSSIRF